MKCRIGENTCTVDYRTLYMALDGGCLFLFILPTFIFCLHKQLGMAELRGGQERE